MANWEQKNPVREDVKGIDVIFEDGRPKIVIQNFNDDPRHKSLSARTSDGVFTLFEGEAYDNVGNWTTEQAVAKVKELALAGKKK